MKTQTLRIAGSIFIAGLLAASVEAAKVKLTQANGRCFTFEEVPCCADWSLAAGTMCTDDCVVAIANPNTDFDPTDVTVSVEDANGQILQIVNNDTGHYDFQGLPLGDYFFILESAFFGGEIARFRVTGITAYSFSMLLPEVGGSYCSPAALNSTGAPGSLSAVGSDVAADNNVTLAASSLPASTFGYFLNSQSQGFVQMPGGSQGNLCLGSSIGRYNSSVFNTGPSGSGSLLLDLTQTPTPGPNVSVMGGETWNFQCWYRDLNPGATSNFTDAVSVVFQ